MKVTARFKVDHVTETDHGTDVQLSAVTDDREENKSWSEYTPSGALTMCVTNPEASKFFEVGKECQLEFSYTPSGALTMCVTNPEASKFFEVGKECQLEFSEV